MIPNSGLTIGIDSVAIKRFAHWHTFSHHALLKLFTPDEIDYCLSIPIKSAERFAARFAAKEALFKALSQQQYTLSFLLCARNSEIVPTHHGPRLHINWTLLNIPPCQSQVSITHTHDVATAIVIL